MKRYEEPKMEVCTFAVEDIVTASYAVAEENEGVAVLFEQ